MSPENYTAVPVDEARLKLGTLVQRSGLRGDVTVLTYRGEPAALIVPLGITPDQLEAVRAYAATLRK